MMDIGNLSLKLSIGLKFKEGSGLKANGIFVILLGLNVFESRFPERKS